jgi:hypothetical protein
LHCRRIYDVATTTINTTNVVVAATNVVVAATTIDVHGVCGFFNAAHNRLA